ncbi:uncharacterized protein LOC120149704 [Hibiscus syriacus]|uniref:uncharacterized protein LOC120149704 n=1 Tax=Hibiscus syriacus TaxID=106335 RepID=UPI0019231DD0|nr:uncharacterized protein LOC120149704 [Hibiscus syriacus]
MKIHVDILLNHFQFIHYRISTTCGKFSTLATIIYASPNTTKRKQLWPHLRSLAGNITSHWIMFGDFNSTLTASAQMNAAISTRPCKNFQNFVYDFDIRDMGFQGLEFTWNRGLSYARLDRALCNSKWDESYLETAIHNLHRMRSDHRPILLCVGISTNNLRPAQFRYFSG